MKKVKISLKRLTARNLIFVQIVYNCFVKWGVKQLGMPSSLNYVTDVITVLLFVEIAFHRMNGYKQEQGVTPTRIMIVFFVYTVINWIIHLYSPIYYLWGLRNTFRFYVFFVASVTFLDKDDVKLIMDIIFVVFVANILMCTYQYFVLNKKYDFIAGFFGGTENRGGNGGLIILCTIVCMFSVVQYVESKRFLMKMITAVAGTLYLGVIAEMKILFLTSVLTGILASLFTKFSLKKLILIVVFITAIPFAIKWLYELYPSFEDFFDIESILEYSSSGYGGNSEGIDRLTAFSYSFDNFLETSYERIFGLGLGAADGSTNYALVTTDFYRDNYDTHYAWFTVPFVLIENGLIGIVLFFLVFLSIFKDATVLKRRYRQHRGYLISVQLLALYMIFFAFNNLSIRTEEVGYLCYALLAMPYILIKGV